MNDALARLAAAAGIEAGYWDALGTYRGLDELTAHALLSALGLDPDGDIDAQVAACAREAPSSSPQPAAAPARCFIPERFASGGRCWGLAVQLYSLRSERNWGIGDFTDLQRLVVIAGRAGAKVVGINPLHARHLARPDEASPYSPSSRLFIDTMMLDVEAIPEYRESPAAIAAVADPGFQSMLAAARASASVDHRTVSALKLEILELVFATFCSRHRDANDSRWREFTEFCEKHGASLARFCEFEALRLRKAGDGEPPEDWQSWPDEWRDPSSSALAGFRIDAAADIEFHAYLQWEAARQLDAVATVARASGNGVMLYRDLAVGAARDSASAWGDQKLTARGISIGAPPDQFSRNGQDWGLPPWNPRELAARGFQPFAALLAANMMGAGALRIDHVMSLLRLFWIPDGMPGAQGAYVRYPFEALTAVVAAESNRNRCMVIGEDLGSVPDGLRERLHDLGFLSYRVLLFERHWKGDGSLKRPHEYPQQALATVVTHDMPTIADFWTFGDIARRAKLGLFPDDAAREQETARRHEERWKILALLSELGLSPADPENTQQITDALHAAIARTPSLLAIVQLDDVLGETEPANIPGTHHEYPNWRRKLSRTLEDIALDPRLERLADVMRHEGRA